MVIEENMIGLAIIKAFLKISVFYFGAAAIMQNVLNNEVYTQIIETMPSKVLMFFGFFYLLFLAVKKGHDTYTHIQMNRMKMDKERERVKQEGLHTESDAKKLNKD